MRIHSSIILLLLILPLGLHAKGRVNPPFFRFIDENIDPSNITLTDPNVKILAEMPGGDLDLQVYRAPHSVIAEYSKLFNIEGGDLKDFPKAPECTRAEIHALRNWTTNEIYQEVNGALRKLHKGLVNKLPIPKKVEDEILVISSGINCAPEFKGATVRVEATPLHILNQYQIGSYIFARGFTSSSKGAEPAEAIPGSDQQIFIHNARGADIDAMGISTWPKEKEVLIRPGTVFKVLTKEAGPVNSKYKNIFQFELY